MVFLIIELVLLAIIIIIGFFRLTWLQTVGEPDKHGLSKQELQAATRDAMTYDQKRRRRMQGE